MIKIVAVIRKGGDSYTIEAKGEVATDVVMDVGKAIQELFPKHS